MATPGRLRAFLDKKVISFASIRFVVVDEADGMLEKDFERVIMKMMNHETMVPKVNSPHTASTSFRSPSLLA